VATIYEIITNKVLERIAHCEETGERFYWKRPYTGGPRFAASYMQYNDATKSSRPYIGINQFILDNMEYISFKQLQDIRGSLGENEAEKIKIKKGAHKYPVFYMGKTDKLDADGKPITRTLPDGSVENEEVWFTKYYSVFALEDIEGLPSHYPANHMEHTITEDATRLEEYINAYARAENLTIDIVKDGSRCFYRPSNHMIRVPDKSGFKSLYAYFSAVMHEIAHSTSRGLGRDVGNGFGTIAYSREELVAQLAASYLLSCFGIVDDDKEIENDVTYLQSWSKYLKDKPTELMKASCHAEKAVRYFIEVAEKQLIKDKFEGLTDVAIQYRDGFLFVQEGADGTYFDYTIFNNDRVLVDGGQITKTEELELGMVVKQLLENNGADFSSATVLSETNKEELLCYERTANCLCR